MSERGHSAFVFWGDKYMSPQGTALSSEATPRPVEITNFASGGMVERKGGLFSREATLSAFIDELITVDDLTPSPPILDHNLTHCYRVPQVGDVFHTFLALLENPTPIGGTIDGLWQADMNFVNLDKDLLWGNGATTGGTLHWATTTATGNGTGSQFGAIAAAETVYAILHIDLATIAGTSPTLAVIVESDATDAWIGAETTRFTFATATDAPANTYQVIALGPGAITDTWWRVTFTITGSAGQTFRWFAGLAKK